MGLGFHARVQALYCGRCGIIFPPKHVYNHLSKTDAHCPKHKDRGLGRKLGLIFTELGLSRDSETIPPTSQFHGQPVLEELWMCRNALKCEIPSYDKIYSLLKTMTNHYAKSHLRVILPDSWPTVYGQKYGHGYNAVFEVQFLPELLSLAPTLPVIRINGEDNSTRRPP